MGLIELPTIEAVLCDVDGTLIEFMDMKRKCVTAALETMIARGLPVADLAEGRRVVDEVYRNHTIEDKLLFWHVAEYTGVKGIVTLERFAQLGKTAYRKRQREFLQPYEGVKETLAALKQKNIQLGILSDAPRDKVFDRLCDTGLEPYFEDNVVGANANRKLLKPSESAFRRGLSMLKRKTGKGVLMVGDDPVRDVGGAKDAGLQAAWAKYGCEPRAGEDVMKMRSRADYELTKFSDILNYIKN